MAQVTRAKLLELEAWARVHLAMPRDEFRAFTLHEWNALARAYREKAKDDEKRFGLLRLTIAQASGAKRANGQDLTLEDFYRDPDKPKRAPRKPKPADTHAQFMSLFGKRTVPANG